MSGEGVVAEKGGEAGAPMRVFRWIYVREMDGDEVLHFEEIDERSLLDGIRAAILKAADLQEAGTASRVEIWFPFSKEARR